MKLSSLSLLFICLLFSCNPENANKEYSFTITAQSTKFQIYLDNESPEVIKWAAQDFAQNIGKIVGKEIAITFTETYDPTAEGIFIGQWDDKLVASLPEDYGDRLQGQWEKFIVKKHQTQLFIVGSDIRGTAFGVFDVAERMDISPWDWWADVSVVYTILVCRAVLP